MIHYHGTPITPRPYLLELAGRHFCVRYGEHNDIACCDEIGQTVMLDNGAYPAWTKGKPVDWPGFYAFCEQWLDRVTTWAVIPDVIEGDDLANDRLIAEWPFGTRGAPVWHLHESLHRLERLAKTWPLICIGSSGQYAKTGTLKWQHRMIETMDTVCDRDGIPITRLHMLRGLDYADGPYPFYSADSTNLARNHAGAASVGRPRRSIVRMANDIDARQPARRWHRVHLPNTLAV